MKKHGFVRTFKAAFLIVGLVLAVAAAATAGVIDNAKFVMNNGAEMVSHSRNITSGVRELYRERQSVRNFIDSAATLIQAYKGLSAKKSTDIPQILKIASAIDTLVREYNYIAPKAKGVFTKIKPDLKFFESMQEVKSVNLGNNTSQLQIRTISDSTLGNLSGLAGWSRVWDSIKDKPSNLFRWGRLSDEYKLGKAEGGLALKACQIAMEGMSYYDEADKSLSQLLDIRKQINGIVSGDLNAILNVGSTINSIQSAGGSVDRLSKLIDSATPRFTQRFNELNAAQDAYLKAHQAYQAKYGVTVGKTATTATTTTPRTTSPQTATTSASSGGAAVDLKSAMAAYQKAYQEYTACVQNSQSTQDQIQAAIEKLRTARDRYERAKAAGK
ncbi:MAG TPA: hypothetical protein PLU72_14270 [Candidatus Ozemobacteraceae bacterium]|nr:hypothetical protein [Candidatus Ozemobacteraceae bacterium]